uniref:Uncharacterized protein n=1 Tax=Elaeophora elaphi TaxID=1147741 RepID=A0A0R3S143_9BILA
MLPFVGSITSNCCSILLRQETSREDLDGGILTVVGLRMANRNNSKMSKELGDNRLVDDGVEKVDSNTMTGSADDILHFQRSLARSAESLYPCSMRYLQSSSMRRLSHNLNNERRRSLLWARPTTEEIMARVSRRASDDPKSLHTTQFDPVRDQKISIDDGVFQNLMCPQ